LQKKQENPGDVIDTGVEDDQLRLIFTCCHPAIAQESRVALTLREVCGLTTEEIARGFLTTPSTLAQRIVRAKDRIREAVISHQVPIPADLPNRLDAAPQVIHKRLFGVDKISLKEPAKSGSKCRGGALCDL
jgi:RNA polymerase sigma-70 factor (ECF subfamily)